VPLRMPAPPAPSRLVRRASSPRAFAPDRWCRFFADERHRRRAGTWRERADPGASQIDPSVLDDGIDRGGSRHGGDLPG
jgi:hypothetical protein